MRQLPKTECWDGHDIDNDIQKYTVMPCAIRALTVKQLNTTVH